MPDEDWRKLAQSSLHLCLFGSGGGTDEEEEGSWPSALIARRRAVELLVYNALRHLLPHLLLGTAAVTSLRPFMIRPVEGWVEWPLDLIHFFLF